MRFAPDAQIENTIAVLMTVRELLDIEPSPATGEITEDEIRHEYYVRCNVWPESARAEILAANAE